MQTLAPLLTIEDYKVLPETGPHYQLINGTLHMSPAPTRFHQHVSLNLTNIVYNWINSSGSGFIYNAPFDVYLDEFNVFQPDLVYVSPKNLHILTDAGVEGAPDLIVEILSPSTRKIDLGPKKKIFAKYGVKEFWAVDPNSRQVQKFELEKSVDSPSDSYDENDTLESAILPGLKIDLNKIFDYQ